MIEFYIKYFHKDGNLVIITIRRFIVSPLQAMLLSSDGQTLVTGGDNGVVEVWQACDFKQLYIYPGCDAGIRAMDLSHDQRYHH